MSNKTSFKEDSLSLGWQSVTCAHDCKKSDLRIRYYTGHIYVVLGWSYCSDQEGFTSLYEAGSSLGKSVAFISSS